MTTPPRTPITTTSDDELAMQWRVVLRIDDAPVDRTLYLMWLDPGGVMLPTLVPVDGVPAEVDRVVVSRLTELHTMVAEAEGVEPADLHLALCLERRGPAQLTPDDHAWLEAIRSITRERDGVDCSLHLGNGRHLTAVLPRQHWPST